jgi:hypothetical protein
MGPVTTETLNLVTIAKRSIGEMPPPQRLFFLSFFFFFLPLSAVTMMGIYEATEELLVRTGQQESDITQLQSQLVASDSKIEKSSSTAISAVSSEMSRAVDAENSIRQQLQQLSNNVTLDFDDLASDLAVLEASHIGNTSNITREVTPPKKEEEEEEIERETNKKTTIDL